MNNEFNKLINTAKQITLPEEKKRIIRARVQDFIDLTPSQNAIKMPLRSPFYLTKFSVMHFSKALSLVLIVLITGGGTVSFASEDTLPGDTFYTVKVNFKEPIEESLAFGPEAKLQVKTKQVEKRLTEAQVLLKKGDMSPEKHKEVESRVEKEVNQISDTIDKLQEKGDIEAILTATSKLEPVLKAHQEALKEVKVEEELSSQTVELASIPLELEETEGVKLLSSTEPETEVVSIAESESSLEVASLPEAETKTEFANNLLRTVERTIERVEEKETKALQTVSEFEKTDTNNTRITVATDRKVSEAKKEIDSIKNILEIQTVENIEIQNSQSSTEISLDREMIIFDESLKKDAILLTLAEAEILLEESKQLFEEARYKEALEKSQAAIKLVASIEATQNIETATKETLVKQEIKTETKLETPEILPAPTQKPEAEKIPESKPILEKPELIDSGVKIEDQASQAIEALEIKLNLKTSTPVS